MRGRAMQSGWPKNTRLFCQAEIGYQNQNGIKRIADRERNTELVERNLGVTPIDDDAFFEKRELRGRKRRHISYEPQAVHEQEHGGRRRRAAQREQNTQDEKQLRLDRNQKTHEVASNLFDWDPGNLVPEVASYLQVHHRDAKWATCSTLNR